MYRIVESIEIEAPVERVFQFLSDIKTRLTLSPAYKLIGFEVLTPGPVGKKTRFKVIIEADGRQIEYVSEIVKFVRNKKIVIKRLDGGLKVTLKLKPTARGTMLIHEEEFVLPEKEKLPPKKEEEPRVSGGLLKDIAEAIKELAFLIYGDPEEIKERERLIAKLREDLRLWLMRIKDYIEKAEYRTN